MAEKNDRGNKSRGMIARAVASVAGGKVRGAGAVAGACALALGGGGTAWGQYEAPNAIYAAPGTYYNSATGTGPTLKANLKTIVSSMSLRTYDDYKYASSMLDQDPANPANILLEYNRASVSGLWDGGSTWNREHLWPSSLLPAGGPSSGTKSQATDLFELRPCDDVINSNRSNSEYGTTASSGGFGYVNSPYWYPGDADSGDIARSMFYMATRYGDAGSPNNLVLVNGLSGGVSQFGDKASMMKWHYTDGISNWERRRNHLVYTSDNGVNGWNTAGRSAPFNVAPYNVNYSQGNRNPYIDHPEYVWAIFGTHTDGGGNIINDSQLSVASPDGGGTSSTVVSVGKVIKNSAFNTTTVTLSRSGSDPTTFDQTPGGSADTNLGGAGQGYWNASSTKSLTVGLSSSVTSTVGAKSGTYTINNTDLTSSAAGRGSADGNDTITVNGTVVDHANGSFTTPADNNAASFDYGYVPQNFAARTNNFSVNNLVAASGWTADLRCTSVLHVNGGGVLSTSGTTFSGLVAGNAQNFVGTLNPVNIGTFTNATATFALSDEPIPGATSTTSLVLTQMARVVSPTSPAFTATSFMDLRTGETFSPAGTSAISSGVTLTRQGPGTWNVGTQSNGANSTLLLTAGATTFNGDAGGTSSYPLSVTTSTSGTALHVNATQHLNALSVGTGTVVDMTAGNNKVLMTKSFTAGGGTLDLRDNRMVALYGTAASPINAIKAAIVSGRNGTDFVGGDWNGVGITSSTVAASDLVSFAVGYVDNSYLPLLGLPSYTSFGGQTVDSSSVLVRYTLGADATLDGRVNTDDVTVVGALYNNEGTGEWYLGDFDYDGIVDSDDVTVLGAMYDATAPALSSAQLSSQFGAEFAQAFEIGRALGPANVPEPSGVIVLGMGAAGLMRRRRRA